MKYLLPLILLLLPLKGFSPREGGGGNVCMYRGELTLLDEFFVDYGTSGMGRFPVSPLVAEYDRDANNEPVINFTKMDVAPLILKTLAWYETKLDKELFREFKDYFLSLDSIYIKKDTFREAWSPDGNARIGCAKGFMRAMMVSTNEGITILSTKDWAALHPQRQQIAMYHEMLRLSQLHSSWFADVLNEELSVFTMMLYFGAIRDIQTHPSWMEMVERFRAELHAPVTKAEIADARTELNTHLKNGEINLAVATVGKLSLLLKRLDIKEGRETGMHFSTEMKKLRAHPLYASQVPALVQDLRNQ